MVAVLLALVALAGWTRLGPGWVQPLTGPIAAVALLLIGSTAGLSRADLGLGAGSGVYGLIAAGLVAAGYAIAAAVPAGRRALLDERQRRSARSALFTALVAVPLATVFVEEVAFRGVLWGLLTRDHGPVTATVVSSALFGLWHVGSAASLARAHGTGRVLLTVLGTVVFTGLAGAVLAWLRLTGGNLIAPVALHWAANGFGVLAAGWAWAHRGGIERG